MDKPHVATTIAHSWSFNRHEPHTCQRAPHPMKQLGSPNKTTQIKKVCGGRSLHYPSDLALSMTDRSPLLRLKAYPKSDSAPVPPHDSLHHDGGPTTPELPRHPHGGAPSSPRRGASAFPKTPLAPVPNIDREIDPLLHTSPSMQQIQKTTLSVRIKKFSQRKLNRQCGTIFFLFFVLGCLPQAPKVG